MRAYQLINKIKEEAEARVLSCTYNIDKDKRDISITVFRSRFRYKINVKLDAIYVTKYEEDALINKLVGDLDSAYNDYLRSLYV